MTFLENNGLGLNLFIQAMLPIQIAEYQRKGGVTDTDIERVREFAHELGAHGDVLLFGGKDGDAGKIAGQLVDALAVMSFVPGGLKSIERWLDEWGKATHPP